MSSSVLKSFVASAILAVAAFSTAAQAQSWPTFELDLTASTVEVQSTGCVFSCTGFRGDFGSGAENFSWTPAAANEQIVVDDFIVWQTSGAGFGVETYLVEAELVFSSPDTQSTSADGGGLVVNLWGDFSAGVLRWTQTARVVFDQGSRLDIAFEGIRGVWNGSVSTAATFMGNLIEPVGGTGGSTSSVPLPGSLVLLLSAFGILGAGRLLRRRANPDAALA